MNRREFLRDAVATLGGLLLGGRAVVEGIGIVVDGDAVMEPLDGWLICEEPRSTKWPPPDCENSFRIASEHVTIEDFIQKGSECAASISRMGEAAKETAASIGDFLESFDCGVTWEHTQSCEGKDWCIPAVDWPPEPCGDAVFYVTDDGDDANDGLTPKSSLQTVSEALSRCSMDGDDSVIVLSSDPQWSFYSARWGGIDLFPDIQRDGGTISVTDFFEPIRDLYPDMFDHYLSAPEGTITYWHKPRRRIST